MIFFWTPCSMKWAMWAYSMPCFVELANIAGTLALLVQCNLYYCFDLSLCHIWSPHHGSPIHLRSISVFLTVILELGYESMKCDLCEALDSGAMRDVGWAVFPHPPSPAPRMHEIGQNNSTHPSINYSPYAPPRQAHSERKKKKKRRIFRLNISLLRFDVRNWSVTFVCCGLF